MKKRIAWTAVILTLAAMLCGTTDVGTRYVESTPLPTLH